MRAGQSPKDTAKLSHEDCRNAMIVEVHKLSDSNLEYLQALSDAALLEQVPVLPAPLFSIALDR